MHPCEVHGALCSQKRESPVQEQTGSPSERKSRQQRGERSSSGKNLPKGSGRRRHRLGERSPEMMKAKITLEKANGVGGDATPKCRAERWNVAREERPGDQSQ